MKLTLPIREVAPPAFRQWVTEPKPDAAGAMAEEIKQWLARAKEMEGLFEKYVYQANDLTELDLRQHRMHLHGFLASGEQFIVDAKVQGIENELQKPLGQMECKMMAFEKTLWEWHGPASAQSDLPDSLKQAFHEVAAGDLEDFDPANL